MAMKRNKKLTSVDKANVLESSGLEKRRDGGRRDYLKLSLPHVYRQRGNAVVRNRNVRSHRDQQYFGDILSMKPDDHRLIGCFFRQLARGNFGMYERSTDPRGHRRAK
jgi:hypothetical protein